VRRAIAIDFRVIDKGGEETPKQDIINGLVWVARSGL